MENLSRRGLLGSAIAVAAVTVTGTGARAATAHSGEVPSVWREFTRTPYTHPQIPYVGRAGYRGGRQASPAPASSPTSCATTARAPTARPTPPPRSTVPSPTPDGPAGARSTCPRARTASTTSSASATPASSCAARAAPAPSCTRPAASPNSIGVYGSRYGGDKSSWSWAGGLIWLCPEDRFRTLTDAIRAKAWPFEGWTGNKRDEWDTLTAVEPAARGSWSVTVADASRLSPRRPGPPAPRRRPRPHPPRTHGGRRRGPRGVRLGRQDQADLVRALRMARTRSPPCTAAASPSNARCRSTYAPSGTPG